MATERERYKDASATSNYTNDVHWHQPRKKRKHECEAFSLSITTVFLAGMP